MCVYCGYESTQWICDDCQSELESEFQQLMLDTCDIAGFEDEE